MNKYINFKVKDFAADDFFCRWVLQNDEKTDAVWNTWLSQHPEKKNIVVSAKKLILSLHNAHTQQIDDDLLKKTWERIDKETRNGSGKVIALNWRILSAAATLLLLTLAGVWLFTKDTTENLIGEGTKYIEIWNKDAIEKEVELADGTIVKLRPDSYLGYPKEFTAEKRMVVLKGAAFFDVSRDEQKPFLVFAQETVTKVLGTSFCIKAYASDENVEVTVRTGKVAVYTQKPSSSSAMDIPQDSEPHLVVTPNQKVVFNRKLENLTKTLAEKPLPVAPLANLPNEKFEETPVGQIFHALEEAYQVEIVFNTEALANCRLTTTLQDLPLFEKLNIICDALGLSYRQEDVKIIIEGQGCKK